MRAQLSTERVTRACFDACAAKQRVTCNVVSPLIYNGHACTRTFMRNDCCTRVITVRVVTTCNIYTFFANARMNARMKMIEHFCDTCVRACIVTYADYITRNKKLRTTLTACACLSVTVRSFLLRDHTHVRSHSLTVRNRKYISSVRSRRIT